MIPPAGQRGRGLCLGAVWELEGLGLAAFVSARCGDDGISSPPRAPALGTRGEQMAAPLWSYLAGGKTISSNSAKIFNGLVFGWWGK